MCIPTTGQLPSTACRFKLHQSLQQAGIVCLITSFVVAMTIFFRKSGTGSTLHQLYTPHFATGVALPAAALLQAVLAGVRPGLTSRFRGLWRGTHLLLGYGTVGLGKSDRQEVITG